MIVKYKNNKIERVCTNYSIAKKEYGQEIADKIFLRISQISSSSSHRELIKFNIGRCHALTGDREGQFAMDLGNPHRLVFSVNESEENEIAIIIEVIDYH